MNKDQLVEAVTEQVGDRRTAAVAVDAVLATVQRAVAVGEKVSLFGFGVFEKADRAARSARNPATGAPVSVAATSVPRFRAGQSFKDVVSGVRPAPALPIVSGPPLARAPRRAPAAATSSAQAVAEPVEVPAAGGKAAAKVETVQMSTKAGGKKADAKSATGKKADAKSATGKKADGKKSDAKKADGKKSDAKKADGKKSDARKSDAKASGKKGDAKASGKKGKR